MDRSSATLLEFIARLTYNVDGLSGKLRLYFSQFLTFHFLKSLSINQIEDIENKLASKRFQNAEEIRVAGSALSFADRCWTVAAIQLLQTEAGRVDDRVISRRLGRVVEDLIQQLDLGDRTDSISDESEKIKQEVRTYNSRPVVRVPARIWPLVADFVLRCSLLVYFSLSETNKSFLTGLNTFVVPLLIMIVVTWYGRLDRRANKKLLDSYGGASTFKIEHQVSARQYTWLAIFLAISTFISYLLPDQLHAFAFFGMAAYYFAYLRFFRVGRIRENDLVRQLESNPRQTDALDVDENDEMIANLETRLNASTSRLDAYVLESALFGALSFSGFLQIMASDLISFADLEKFAEGIFTTSQALIHLQWHALAIGLAELNNKVNLFCLVSVESLLCSIFFLAVIASRLRFSDVADNVRRAITLARAFNSKEEALYHESERSEIRQSRLQALTTRVNGQLREAELSLAQIDPVMAYMEYFRNAGILVFFVILISSSLFITSVLGWTFLALIAATFLYFNRDVVNANLKASFLQLRLVFLRRAHWFFIASVTPFVIALILRNSFFFVDTQVLMASGYLLTCLFLFVWLMLGSHYDEDFGDIEKKDGGRRLSRWNMIKNSTAAMILLYGVAMAFKMLHLTGADEMAVLGTGVITLLMYFTGYYLSKVKWFGLISGAVLGTSTLSILFKTLHITGDDEMMLIGVIGLIICTIVVWWKSSLFHSLLLRFCFVLLFLTVSMLSGAFLRLELAYAHRTLNLAPIMRVIEVSSGNFLVGNTAPPLIAAEYVDAVEAINATEWYMTTYGTRVPFGAVYQELVRRYDYLAGDVLWRSSLGAEFDTTMLQNALGMARERDKILELFEFPDHVMSLYDMGLQADALVALKRREEAIHSLNEFIQKLRNSEQRQLLAEKLSAITNGSQ